MRISCRFTFYVAPPSRSIETRSLPTLARAYPRRFTFYVAPPSRSILNSYFLLAAVIIRIFTFEVIGGSLRTPSSRRRSKSSETFA